MTEDERDLSADIDHEAIVEKETAPSSEIKEIEVEEAPKPKKRTRRKKMSRPKKKEPVKKEVVEKRTPNISKHTYDAWWNEIGIELVRRGYSSSGVVKRAQSAFGSEFNKEWFIEYCDKHNPTTEQEKVKAVWESQK